MRSTLCHGDRLAFYFVCKSSFRSRSRFALTDLTAFVLQVVHRFTRNPETKRSTFHLSQQSDTLEWCCDDSTAILIDSASRFQAFISIPFYTIFLTLNINQR